MEEHEAIFGEGEGPFPILRLGGFDGLGFAAAKGPGLAGGLYDVNNPAKKKMKCYAMMLNVIL